ncbi:hypothetical protein VUR80DRAFT_1829 [Thermomyces stellatus]
MSVSTSFPRLPPNKLSAGPGHVGRSIPQRGKEGGADARLQGMMALQKVPAPCFPRPGRMAVDCELPQSEDAAGRRVDDDRRRVRCGSLPWKPCCMNPARGLAARFLARLQAVSDRSWLLVRFVSSFTRACFSGAGTRSLAGSAGAPPRSRPGGCEAEEVVRRTRDVYTVYMAHRPGPHSLRPVSQTTPAQFGDVPITASEVSQGRDPPRQVRTSRNRTVSFHGSQSLCRNPPRRDPSPNRGGNLPHWRLRNTRRKSQ